MVTSSAPSVLAIVDGTTPSEKTLLVGIDEYDPWIGRYPAVTFDPAIAGQSSISIEGSEFILTYGAYPTFDATVRAPEVKGCSNEVWIGVDTQDRCGFYLEVLAPEPVSVTAEVSDPSVAVLAQDGATAGAATVTWSAVDTRATRYVYLQGLSEGLVTVTIRAAGYTDRVFTVRVTESGAWFWTTTPITLASGASTDVDVLFGAISATTRRNLALRPGAIVEVPVSSDDPGIVSATSSVTFSGGTGTIVWEPVTLTATASTAGQTFVRLGDPSDPNRNVLTVGVTD